MPESTNTVCGGCDVRPPWEHRCWGDGCECELCALTCETCGTTVPEKEADGWTFNHLPEGIFPTCPECSHVE